MKFNILNNIKTVVACICSVLLVAIIILCVFGFNFGPDVKGYIEVKVNHGAIYYENSDEFVEDVVKLLKDNDAKVIVTNLEETGFTQKVVIKVAKKFKDRQQNIEYAEQLKEIVDKHYNNELLITSSALVEGIMTNPTIINFTYTVLIAIIIVMIYLVFRLKLLNTVCILGTTLATLIIMTALMVITRVQLNASALGVMLIVMLLSTILSTFRLADMKNTKNEVLTHKEVGVINFKSPSMIMYAITIVSLLVLVILGSSIVKAYALLAILGLISVCVGDNIILMPACYYLNNYTVAKVKPQEAQTPETEQEVDETAGETVDNTPQE